MNKEAVGEAMNVQTYRITGMDCAECAQKVQKGVGNLPGVQRAEADFVTMKLMVQGNADVSAIRQRVEALGYGLAVPRPKAPQHLHPHGHNDYSDHSHTDASTTETQSTLGGVVGFFIYLSTRWDTRLSLFAGVLIVVAMLIAAVAGETAGSVANLLLLGALVIAAFPAAQRGINALVLSRMFSIDLLMVIAATGAIVIGELWEGAVVVVLYTIGEALEGYTADRARGSLRGLMQLAPATAIRLDGETETVISADALRVGDHFLVKPGERIATDGRVTTGQSDVNQAPVTGESIPVLKSPGAEIYAGTVNGTGMLRVEVTRAVPDNTLSRIIHLVEEAQSSRAPSQRLVDRFAAWYTPLVVAAALIIAVLPPLLLNQPLLNTSTEYGWLHRAISLLVIACPCALVISAPVTVISGITAAARRGVLIKGGLHLENLATVRAFAFDKTGTLTKGQPQVKAARTTHCDDQPRCDHCDDLLALASAVEQRSTHPLARAVVDAASSRQIAQRYPAAEQIETLAGQGVQGQVNGRTVTVASHAYFDERFPHNEQLHTEALRADARGQTTMLLAEGNQVRGYITVTDQVREDSRSVVIALNALNAATVMLTGDNAAVAATVGAEVGVSDVRAGLLPQDKVTAVRELEAMYGSVAMIGDGINDTPALAAATVGIAMGGIGSAQAMEIADVVLMGDDLRHLPGAIKLARFTRRLIMQNVSASLGLKLVFLTLSIAGLSSLWLAILADIGVATIVTLNGMRPLRR